MGYQGCMEVVSADSAVWDAVIEEMWRCDYPYAAAYHQLCERRGQGRPVMPVYRDSGYTIAFPMMFRDIYLPGDEHPVDGLVDVSSVPAPIGPVASVPEVPEEVRLRFLEAMQEFMEENGVVSIYSRMHTLMGGPALLVRYGQLVQKGVEVAVDLTPAEEQQVARYQRGHRRDIIKLKDMGVVCEQVGAESLDAFVSLYHESMDRLGADRSYYFDTEYFRCMILDVPGNTYIMRCRNGDEVVGLGFVVTSKDFVHFKYAGINPDYNSLSPVKLMIDAAREWGSRAGARVLFLGSGFGGNRDSLYEFKMAFGGHELDYCAWRHIVNRSAYQDLCTRASELAGFEPDDSYFPCYRNPALQQQHRGEASVGA